MHMTYAALRKEFCEKSLHISRNDLKKTVVDITGRPVVIIKTALDTKICRGFYLSSENKNHKFVSLAGKDAIVLAQGMNRCWDRFVIAKELMHMFDQPNTMTDSGDKFDQLLFELSVSEQSRSPQLQSEIKAFWMALGALCPESFRNEFRIKRESNTLTDYDIALQFRIPEMYVPLLFQPRFSTIVESLETD